MKLELRLPKPAEASEQFRVYLNSKHPCEISKKLLDDLSKLTGAKYELVYEGNRT